MSVEYRLRWRRQGLGIRTKLYQDRAAAERWALILQGKMAEATGLDPEAYACCDGRDDGCGGRTNEQVWADRPGQPPLVELALEVRAVRPWQSVLTYELPEVDTSDVAIEAPNVDSAPVRTGDVPEGDIPF